VLHFALPVSHAPSAGAETLAVNVSVGALKWRVLLLKTTADGGNGVDVPPPPGAA
jgi:hypothetical protein